MHCVATVLVAMKSEINAEVALEMGLTSEKAWRCPCEKKWR